MAQAAERVLGRRITGRADQREGRPRRRLRRIELNECGHPVPDERGVAGAERIAEIAAAAQKDDLVLCLISGGGSALLPLPAAPVTLEEKQAVTRLLLNCGANIHEINAVRKHISAIKGGQLARLAAPATVEALLLSDVIGDDLDVIGSGPTAPDASTFASAAAILERYGILGRVPSSVRRADGAAACAARFRRRPSRPTRSSRACATPWWAAIGWRSMRRARRARALGFRTLVLASGIQGETRDVARMHAAIAREMVRDRTAGEAAGLHHHRRRNHGHHQGRWPGRPEPGVRAGGCHRYRRARRDCGVQRGHGWHRRSHRRRRCDRRWRHAAAQARKRCAYLDRNDSYHYFEALDDLLITGPTNTNVMDVRIVLVGSRK